MDTATKSPQHIELQVGGMTCASCVARIEKKLNKLDGVSASVNFATGKASVDYAEDVSPDRLVAAVEQAGYTAALPKPSAPVADGGRATAELDPAASLRQRLRAPS